MERTIHGSGTGRRGITTVEFFFAVLILALALIPIYDIFIGSYRSVFRSKHSYVAQHVAREIMEEMRQLPFDTLEAGAWHDWTPVGGHVLALTIDKAGLATATDKDDGTLEYPKEYERIQTKLGVEEVTDADGNVDPKLRKVVLEVRWQETGSGGLHQQAVLDKFECLIADLRR